MKHTDELRNEQAEHTTPEARMAGLARTFPDVKNAPGVFPCWSSRELDRWAADESRSVSERMTARFLLNVWDPEYSWRCGQFNPTESLQIWNEKHRRAFLSWKKNQWWPKPYEFKVE